MLSAKYSVEEMRLLGHLMDRCEKENYERHVKEALANHNVAINTGIASAHYAPGPVGLCGVQGVRHVLHLDDEPTVNEPMENMPLYINDKDYNKRAIAIFRMQVGR